MYDDFNILSPVIYLCIILNLGHKVYSQICTDTLMLIYIGSAREFFHFGVIFLTWYTPYGTR